MSKKIYRGSIPFSKNGEVVMWAADNSPDIDWKPNEPFDATLYFYKFYKCRSAHRMIFKDSAGMRVSFFFSEMDTIIKNGLKPGGVISGKFTYSKRGAVYGAQVVSLESFVVENPIEILVKYNLLKEPPLTDTERAYLREYGKIPPEYVSKEYIQYLETKEDFLTGTEKSYLVSYRKYLETK